VVTRDGVNLDRFAGPRLVAAACHSPRYFAEGTLGSKWVQIPFPCRKRSPPHLRHSILRRTAGFFEQVLFGKHVPVSVAAELDRLEHTRASFLVVYVLCFSRFFGQRLEITLHAKLFLVLLEDHDVLCAFQ
jgi:hypothetical protein